jgi:hypothetical protein
LFWHGLFDYAGDVAARTPRAATSLLRMASVMRHTCWRLGSADRSADTTRAGRQRHCGFSLRPASLCSTTKPQRLWLCHWLSDSAPMSPLRAVVSRGHIPMNLLY